MALHTVVLDFLKAKIDGGRIAVRDFMGYDQTRVYNTLGDNDFVTKGMMDQNPTKIPYAIIHLPAGSAYPTTVDTSTEYPQFGGSFQAVPVINLGSNTYEPVDDIPVQYVNTTFPGDITITSIIIYGHPDPSDPTITIDDTYIILTAL